MEAYIIGAAKISIHAPREGSDILILQISPFLDFNFNPRSP